MLFCLRYGICKPTTAEDIAWLKQLRASSLQAIAGIGLTTQPPPAREGTNRATS